MELGLATFGDTAPDAVTGIAISAEERLRNLIEEVEAADQAGLDLFAVGEHHRPDFAVSSPAIVLAAAAVRTKRIRLSSAVTVLSSDDPVRVFQDFATVDLLSGGRAEIMAGRGSFTESFPLFGQDLADYDELFATKLELLLKVRESVRVTWPGGKDRAPIDNLGVYPRPIQEPLPVWVAVGGSANSVARAGGLGLPLMIAIIGGSPERFVPFADLYRESAARAGHDESELRVGINSHTFVADDSQAAADTFFPAYAGVMSRIGRERGWQPMTRNQYEALRSPRGAILVGSPQEVVEKILFEHDLFHHDRFLAQMSVGTLAHRDAMRSIELFATNVAPAVRKALASGSPAGTAEHQPATPA